VKILIVVDQLPKCDKVVNFGELIASHTKSNITLLHVAEKIEHQGIGEALLEQASQLVTKVPVEMSLCFGKIVTKVLYEARQGDFDLVILGAQLGDKLSRPQQSLSPASWSIISRTRVSVLVVQQNQPKFSHILICTGGQAISEPAIEAGAQLAKVLNADVSLLHVAGAIPSMYTGLDEIEETLPELLSSGTPLAQHLRRSAAILDKYVVPSQLKLRHGVVNDEILRELSLGDYDLIITGSPESSRGLKRLLMGDVVETIIENSALPVLIIKKPLNILRQAAVTEL
jgi:nucleotide-binding universal stress UspA family protein